MKNNLIKLFSLLVVLSMVLTLAACGDKSTSQAQQTQEQQKTQAAAETKKEEAKPVTLKLWHMWVSDGDGNKKPFENVLKTFGEQVKDVKLEVDGIDNESYKTKIKTAMAANEIPDIFFTWGAGFSKPFVDSGKVLALDEYLGDIKDKLKDGVLTNFTYGGKTYGIPFSLSVAPLYCNKDIFDANGVKIPETYEDLLAAVKVFKSKGITPMVCGAKDKWPAMFYYDVLALRTAGAQVCNDALNKNASFDQAPFIEAAAKLDELSKAGAFGNNTLGLSWDEAIIAFTQSQAAMIYNGNWVASSCEDEKSKVKGKVVATRFPTISGAAGKSTEWFGGAADGFMISANTTNKDASVKAVKFLAENMAKEAYLAGAGLPSWNVKVEDKSKINPLVSQISDLTSGSSGFVLWWDVFLEGADADVHKDLVVQVLAGKKSPQDFAKEMQKLNEKK